MTRPLILLLRYALQAALVVYCVVHLIWSIAHADERTDWLRRYTIQSDAKLIEQAASALDCSHLGGVRPGLRWRIGTPDDGMVSGPAPRAAVPDGQPCVEPKRSFAR